MTLLRTTPGMTAAACFSSTGLTVAFAVVEIGIKEVVWMALRTMRSAGHILTAVSAPHILGVSDRLSMFWVHAMSDFTNMMKFKPDGDWAKEQFITMPVGQDVSPEGIEEAVAIMVTGFRPEPTGLSLFNLCPETFLRRDSRHSKTLRSIRKPKVLAMGLRLAPKGSGAL